MARLTVQRMVRTKETKGTFLYSNEGGDWQTQLRTLYVPKAIMADGPLDEIFVAIYTEKPE